MNGENASAVMKSVSEGKLGVEEVKLPKLKTQDSFSRLKCTFTLSRNPFHSASRMLRRRAKQNRDSKDGGSAAGTKDRHNMQQHQQQVESMQQNIGRLHGSQSYPDRSGMKKSVSKTFVEKVHQQDGPAHVECGHTESQNVSQGRSRVQCRRHKGTST